jgi:mTERF domain-containing protein
MRVPVALLFLLCATPVGSAFGLVGGGGAWYASESSRCARHDCTGRHQNLGTGSGLASCRRAFAFASTRYLVSHPSVVAITKSRNGHVLRAASEEDGISEERAELLEERKEQLRVLLSASKREIDNLVRQNPSLLERRNVEGNHAPKLKLLQERLGISEKAAGRLCLKFNRLLCSTLATLEKKMDWLQARLNLSKSQLRTIVKRSPIVLGFSIGDNLEPTIDNIQSSLELSDEEMTKMIVRQPDVLLHNISAENMKQRLSLLREILDVPKGTVESVPKYIKRDPALLFWKEESMKENQLWIQQRFGLGDARIAHMCRHQPQLLYANTTTLDNKADSIQADLSLSDDELSDLVSKYAPILCCYSPEKNVRPKLQYLRTRFELDDDALKDLILKSPPLFGYPTDNIEEKLQFYSNLIGEREAKRLVVKSSNLLRQSLEKRLKPRLEEVEKSGAKVRWNETLIRRLAIRTNDQWERYKLGDAKRGPRKD